MGRLTLNVLLSFAQFEREVTGERIRDKIAASKRKGMWMGGMPPLGYDIPTDRISRALVINPAEAELVRDIYGRYLRLKSVNAMRDELARDGVRSKAWVSRKGRAMGGAAFNTGSLFHLLQSRVYIGEITHKDERYPGCHQPIVAAEIFEAVQAQIAVNARARRDRSPARTTMPLTGRIFDAAGHRMGPCFAYGKAGKRHAYYVSVPLQRGIKPAPGVIGRVPAGPLHDLILQRLRGLLAKPTAHWDELLPAMNRVDIDARAVRLALDLSNWNPAAARVAISELKSRLQPGDILVPDTRNGHTFELIVSVRPVFRGGRTWLARPNGQDGNSAVIPDRKLLAALARGHVAMTSANASPTMVPTQWRHATSPADSFLREFMSLAFLAPDIQRALLVGRQRAGLSAAKLLQNGVPLAWADQRAAFGF